MPSSTLHSCLGLAFGCCALWGLAGCSDSSSPEPDAGGIDPGVCGAVVKEHEDFGASHVPICSDVSYVTSPPTSGAHYGSWPQYKTYAEPLPHGFMVHGLEHGAVVFSYNCPDGCASEVAAAQAMIDQQLPGDVFCASQGVERQRVILTPDPELKSRWAAAAWRWSLTADCFDLEPFLAFYQAHYDQAPEHVCSDGIDVGADAGLPSDCGPPRD